MINQVIMNKLLAVQNEELRAKLHLASKEFHHETKQLQQRIKLLESRDAKLMTETCEWICLQCKSEYYGRAAIEVGSFKCLNEACAGMQCMPRKHYKEYLNNLTEQAA